MDYPQVPTDYRRFPKEYRAALFADAPKPTPQQLANIAVLKQYVNPAVKVAEGNPRNFGVLSEKIDSPQKANRILNESIRNSYLRWLQSGMPGKFVDFMSDRWAPIGAENDPENLNPNWRVNVRKNLLKQLGQETYNEWKRMNLVKNPETTVAV